MSANSKRGAPAADVVTFAPLAVSPETAASMTGTTRTIIFDAIGAGDLRAFKCRRRRLILVKDLDDWITGLAGYEP
ncbi:MAG: DNA-binding protein [Pseudomonadota bacterium]|nr:DNA-binding protein [Pseudomonadota bacterium]